MATIKRRINISMSEDVQEAIKRLALRDQVPEATKAGHLLRLAIEIEEDHVLDVIAGTRDQKRVALVPHSIAWR